MPGKNNSPLRNFLGLSLVKHTSDLGEEDGRPIQDVSTHDHDGPSSDRSSNVDEPRRRTCMDTVIAAIQQEDWRVQVDNDRNLVHTQGNGKNGSFNIAIDVKEDLQLLIVYAVCPVRVPEGIQRVKVAEFLTRANYGIMIGNFELDFRDGEIRYKAGLEYLDGVVTTKMVWHMILKCALTLDHYFCGIMSIIYANVEPVEAIQEIEPSQAAGNALRHALVEAQRVQAVNDDNDEEIPIVAATTTQETEESTEHAEAEE